MREMIDWIGAEAERVEESGVVRRRGRFTHEGIGELPAHSFPGRGSELTTEGTEGKGERGKGEFLDLDGRAGRMPALRKLGGADEGVRPYTNVGVIHTLEL